MGAAQRRLFVHGTPILTYHKLGQPPQGTKDPFLYARSNDFNAQLNALANEGYRLVTLDEIAPDDTKRSPQFAPEPPHPARGHPLPQRGKGKGEGALGEKEVRRNEFGEQRIALTFDDGFVSALREGLPILGQHNARAIQFIVAGLIGKQNAWDIQKDDVAEPLMDEAQIKDWLAAGHQIGSHSMTHRNLKKLNAAEAREEIFGSKKLLEDKFGVAVRHFCYPFGGWNPAVRELVIEAGYGTACTVAFGVNPPGCDPFALHRIMPYSSGELLWKVIHRALRRVQLT